MSRIGPGDTLRILLVAERESLREQIGAILAQYAGDHRLFWVAQAEVAAKRAEDLADLAVRSLDAHARRQRQ